MNVIERRLEILRIMNAKRKSNVAELAETLNVSTRTIQRDIQALITVVPLVCISGNGGGIQLLDGYHLHNNIFTKEENGFGELVYETVNTNSLSAFVKEQISENQDSVPEWLSGLVNIYEQTSVSVRKSTK